jgi:hypothetical protein
MIARAGVRRRLTLVNARSAAGVAVLIGSADAQKVRCELSREAHSASRSDGGLDRIGVTRHCPRGDDVLQNTYPLIGLP